jgi:predicted exporter
VTARARITLGWLVAVVAAGLYAATQLRVDADFSAFLPDASGDAQRFLVRELKEGLVSRLLLIELAGDSPARLAKVSKRFGGLLAGDREFTYVNNGDAEWSTRDFDVLREHRYQLSDAATADRFTADGLRSALQMRVRELATGSGLFEKTLLPEDPTGETLHLVQQLAPAKRPQQQFGVWFSPEGKRALLLAETRAKGSDLDGQTRAIAAVERAFQTARGDTTAAIRYSSPGVMAAKSRTVVAHDATRLALTSTLLIVAILAFAYRSPLVVVLCALPALSGLLIGMAAVNAAFESVHAITLGFGATLLGETVDYPGYLLTQKRTAESVGDTLFRLRRTFTMAVLTTAAAAMALLLAGFSGLAQLGLLTMVGILAAGAVTAGVLPRWVPAGWRGARQGSIFRGWRITLGRQPRAILALVLAVLLFSVAFGKPWWDDDLANLNPLPSELKLQDRDLRTALGAPDVRSMLLIDGPSEDAVLRSSERLRPVFESAVAARVLGSFELVSDYVPSVETQLRRKAALPEAARLRENFADAARGLPLRQSAFEPFFAAVAAARAAPQLNAGDLAGTALGLKIDGLLHVADGRWFAVVPLAEINDQKKLQAAVFDASIPGVRWIDLQQTSREMMSDFRAHALAAFGVGAFLILVVLMIGLSSIVAVVRVALPVGIAVCATAAAMVSIGSPLTVFHLVALMLVAGIGIDYALFIDAGIAIRETQDRIFRSLAIVAGTTVCAFGTLASSQVSVLRAIGVTVTVGVFLSLAFCLLLSSIDRAPYRNA